MDVQRFLKGAGWGLAGTAAMSALMLIGVASGLSPMPKPIPVAIAGRLLGPGTARPVLMGLALLSHFAYGAFVGGVFALATTRVTVRKGLGLGVALWLFMQIAVLPVLGWGAFGSGITAKIAVATLVLHLLYGASYGALMDRRAAAVSVPPVRAAD